MASNYTKTVWTNGSGQPLNKTNLDKIEDGLFKASDGAFIKQWYEAEANTNAFTDAEKIHLATPSAITLNPVTTPPTFQKGQLYFDDNREEFVAQGTSEGAEIRIGHTQHIHVINNSGAIIEKGMAVRHDGVDINGNVQIVKAIATSFANARIFGVAQQTINNGAEGAIMTFGEVYGFDTSSYTAGVPLYLSDTIAGTFTETPPNIVSRVGGCLVSDTTNGRFFVAIINNTNLPTIYGGLKSLTSPTIASTTTAQDITGYTTETESVVTVDATTGIITLPHAGAYRANFVASMTFPTDVSNRTVTFEVYDVTATAIAYSYVKNLAKDSVADSLSFSFPATAVVNNQLKMRVKSSVAINLTFSDIVFDVESVNITP